MEEDSLSIRTSGKYSEESFLKLMRDFDEYVMRHAQKMEHRLVTSHQKPSPPTPILVPSPAGVDGTVQRSERGVLAEP